MELEGRLRKCVRYKTTRAGRRCAKYVPLAEVEELAEPRRIRRSGIRRIRVRGRGIRCATYTPRGFRFVKCPK
ncbi:MAG: hypothetical protein QW156_05030 [Candidatus Aenigmatarchaeota archaeon]